MGKTLDLLDRLGQTVRQFAERGRELRTACEADTFAENQKRHAAEEAVRDATAERVAEADASMTSSPALSNTTALPTTVAGPGIEL